MDRSILGKNTTEFNEIDPFHGNRLEGVICHDSNEYYGALFIERINGEAHPQLIMATPKMHYPFDKAGTYHFPTAKYIEVFEKLDGTNILAYRYTDGNKQYLTYKTRLNAILKSGRFGDFLSMWKEVATPFFADIEQEVERSNCNLSFELYGAKNLHLILYKEPLAFKLLFGVRNSGDILSPTSLSHNSLPTLPILTSIDKSFQERYTETRVALEATLAATVDGHYSGEEGTVWYCHLPDGRCLQIKCKPETVEAIHFAAGAHMSKNSILATIWNSLENTDSLSLEYITTLLSEEYEQYEIELNRPMIQACIELVNTEVIFKDKVLSIFGQIHGNIATDKQRTMRELSAHFPKNLMGKVYGIISNETGRNRAGSEIPA